jgi:hypothetical protein
LSDLLLVFPEISDDLVSNMMVAITRKIHESGSEIAEQGFLGGTYGYGAHYKNDVFEMRPFHWGDCICEYDILRDQWESSNSHDDGCYQTIFRKMHWENFPESFNYKEGHGWDDQCDCVEQVCKMFGINPNLPGSYVHCTCDYDMKWHHFIKTISHSDECQIDKPNFKHFATGAEIEWYKYIGRDMTFDDKMPIEMWVKLFKECLDSI